MNIFETEIAKYERRLKRIESSTGANMLKSNKVLYQALLAHNKEQLRWWQEDKPFIAMTGAGLE
ncbi:MAG: hypothetical protein HYY32_04410, partial [Chloroflexi bacterium]|nr:hypothetical protein [Chloroflexota bacterium]